MPSTTLSWTGGDPEGDPVTYDVYLEAGTDTPQVLICTDIESTNCAPPSGLLPETVYYWQVVATDDSNAARSGAVWMFQTGPAVVEDVIFRNGFECMSGHCEEPPLTPWHQPAAFINAFQKPRLPASAASNDLYQASPPKSPLAW